MGTQTHQTLQQSGNPVKIVITLIHSTFLYSLIKVQIKVNVKIKVKVEVKLPLWVPQRLLREWRYSSPHS